MACGNIKTMPNGFLSPAKPLRTALVLLIATLVEQGSLIPVTEYNSVSHFPQGQGSKEFLIHIYYHTPQSTFFS